MSKEFYKSKTFWFNVVTILIGVVEVISNTYPIDPQVLLLINGLGNLFLRLLSGDPITIAGWSLYKGKQ